VTDLTDRLQIRPATIDDVPAIVGMLADDPLGATRESPADLAPYLAAFERLGFVNSHAGFKMSVGK
jgi:hypothetical protein